MKITSDGVMKLLKSLEEEKTLLYKEIDDLCTYVVSIGETAEAPEFNLEETLKKIDEIDAKVVKLHHARNVFNSQKKLPCGISVDEALVKLAQLSNRLGRYKNLASNQPKIRYESFMTKEVGYKYANYDIPQAKERYKELLEEIQQIQTQLNYINATEVFEVDD